MLKEKRGKDKVRSGRLEPYGAEDRPRDSADTAHILVGREQVAGTVKRCTEASIAPHMRLQ